MINKFCKKPLRDCTIKLTKVAAGAEKADLVIQNARLINVCTHEIMENITCPWYEGIDYGSAITIENAK